MNASFFSCSRLARWGVTLWLLNNSLFSAEPERPERVGELVTIGAHRMHILCEGPTNADPVIVFESGGGGTSQDWSRVKSFLPGTVRTCVYDRAGAGRSEPGPAPRTM